MTFDPTAYGPAVAAILGDGGRLMPLGPGSPDEALRAKLHAIDLPPAARAGLWLYHDFLDESHAISQDIADSTGSFWHARLNSDTNGSSSDAYSRRCTRNCTFRANRSMHFRKRICYRTIANEPSIFSPVRSADLLLIV